MSTEVYDLSDGRWAVHAEGDRRVYVRDDGVSVIADNGGWLPGVYTLTCYCGDPFGACLIPGHV